MIYEKSPRCQVFPFNQSRLFPSIAPSPKYSEVVISGGRLLNLTKTFRLSPFLGEKAVFGED
jgi:hypothetical protein